MGRMSAPMKWWTRLAAAVTGVMLTLVVPVHAWAASNGVGDVAIEAAKYRRRRSGFGFFPIFGGLCCLLVVGGIVLAIFLIMRNRKKPRP